ncbi:MAG TPA: hypothetical protein VGP25_04660 [Gemmatimonadaceae bacterium]|jgi:hypothetical protein|nr:hypothetical protein [Gemmatimonadaceae bacterium]
MRTWKLAVLWTPLIVAACDDVHVVPTQTPNTITSQIAANRPADHSVSAAGQAPPASVPPEFQHYTSVEVSADAGFNGATAYGQSLVRYGGNNGIATVDLVARNAVGAIVGSNTGVTADSHVFPSTYSVTASTNILLSSACGNTVNASARGEVFDNFISANQSMLSWGRKQGSDAKGAAQPLCPVTTPPVCKAPSVTGRRLDCNSPPAGGGDGSTQPPTQTPPPEPPPYVPPYYSPKNGQYVCVIHGEGTDWQWSECHWVENNDNRAPAAGALRSAFVAPTGDALLLNDPEYT